MRIFGRFFGELLLLGALSILAVLSGCMAMDTSPRERLVLAQREYTDGIRWSRLDDSVQKLPADKRVGFVDRHKALEEDLEVADWDLVSIDLDDKSKVRTAKVRVQYQWILRNQGIVRKTTTRQDWEDRDGKWTLVREERVRGTPLTIFDEPARASTSK
jgi:hypothetical protein